MQIELELWRLSIRSLRKLRRQQVVDLVLTALARHGDGLSSVQLAAETKVPVFTLGELIANHPQIRKSIRIGVRMEGKRASVWYQLVDVTAGVK